MACERGAQVLLTILGSFVAFSLMTIAIGTDFWLYSRAYICNTTNITTDETVIRKTRGDMTHSGLWRTCCIEGIHKGSCFQINHFPGDDYDADISEYLLRIVRAASLFPILSTILLLMGGLLTAIGRIYSSNNTILLSAGILFVAAGLSNIIGIIVYISSDIISDPSDKRDEEKRNAYSYGWSFYFGALSFIVAESIGVLAVNIYIEKNKEQCFRARREFIKATSSSSPYSRIPSYRYRRRHSRSSSRSSEPSREPSPVGMKMGGTGGGAIGGGAVGGGSGGGSIRNDGFGMTMAMADMSMYSLGREPMMKAGSSATTRSCSPQRNTGFLQVHNCFQKDYLKDSVNRRTTPV